jgi:hypothetical protein
MKINENKYIRYTGSGSVKCLKQEYQPVFYRV